MRIMSQTGGAVPSPPVGAAGGQEASTAPRGIWKRLATVNRIWSGVIAGVMGLLVLTGALLPLIEAVTGPERQGAIVACSTAVESAGTTCLARSDDGTTLVSVDVTPLGESPLAGTTVRFVQPGSSTETAKLVGDRSINRQSWELLAISVLLFSFSTFLLSGLRRAR